MKTAALFTARPGVIAFKGAYHGLGYGTLNLTDRPHYRTPFAAQIAGFAHFIPYPSSEADLGGVADAIRTLSREASIGAIVAEPVQGRGGIRVPPSSFLPLLRSLCDELGLLLVLDEIYTGFGRTGRWFAAEHARVVPDVVCLGKGLTGGFPLSACVGAADIMDRAWPEASGDPLHTSTFLGHPVGCAMALAQIAELEERRLIEHAACLGAHLCNHLTRMSVPQGRLLRTRSLGLMAGIEILKGDGTPDAESALRVVEGMLRKGYLLLPDGVDANVVTLTPPLTITEADLNGAFQALGDLLVELPG